MGNTNLMMEDGIMVIAMQTIAVNNGVGNMDEIDKMVEALGRGL